VEKERLHSSKCNCGAEYSYLISKLRRHTQHIGKQQILEFEKGITTSYSAQNSIRKRLHYE